MMPGSVFRARRRRKRGSGCRTKEMPSQPKVSRIATAPRRVRYQTAWPASAGMSAVRPLSRTQKRVVSNGLGSAVATTGSRPVGR
jgi:hypothetical protein